MARSASLKAPGSGTAAAQMLAYHRERALRQIAEIIGEIGIDAIDDGLVRIVAVLAEGHFAHEEVAQRIDAVGVGSMRRDQ